MSDVQLQELEGNLLERGGGSSQENNENQYESDEDEREFRFKCIAPVAKCFRPKLLKVVSCCGGPLEVFLCLLSSVFVIIGTIVTVSLFIPWGKAAWDPKLPSVLDEFQTAGWRLTTVCLYKQYNNGPESSDDEQLGMMDRQSSRDPKTSKYKFRSPDILFYHHQGNIVELTGPNNETRWMQITFSENGLAWRYGPVPLMNDVLRYTKECYWKCGTIPHAHQDPVTFKAYMLTQKHRHYNGFLLNCLQFSQELFDALEPDNLGCAPADFVNKALMATPPFPRKSPEAADSDDSEGD